MKKMIGIKGGSSLCELGTTSDIQLFFDCIKKYTIPNNPEKNWTLLIDRLYKRYLKKETVNESIYLMEIVQTSFKQTNVKLHIDKNFTNLNTKLVNLEEIFSKYFKHFFYCIESAKLNYEAFKDYPGYQYEAVRIITSDMPEYLIQKKIIF